MRHRKTVWSKKHPKEMQELVAKKYPKEKEATLLQPVSAVPLQKIKKAEAPKRGKKSIRKKK